VTAHQNRFQMTARSFELFGELNQNRQVELRNLMASLCKPCTASYHTVVVTVGEFYLRHLRPDLMTYVFEKEGYCTLPSELESRGRDLLEKELVAFDLRVRKFIGQLGDAQYIAFRGCEQTLVRKSNFPGKK
jgi:hypothetical protein